MSWIGLEWPEPGRVIKVQWGQKVYEALDKLYESRGPFKAGYLAGDLIPDIDLRYKVGDINARIKEVHSGYGYFSYDVYVQGKRVLKDEDPIYIADIFAAAVSKITQAIDASILRTPVKIVTICGYGYTTAAPLYTTSLKSKRVVIKVDKNAPGCLIIGGYEAQEFMIDPGEKQDINIDDPSKIYVRSIVNGVKFYALFELLE